MSSKPFKILISGSGIAGSVFASWLLKAHPNADITIVERDPCLRLTGASVDIRSSAVDIIKWMGAEAEIRKHTTNEAGGQLVRADGTAIATLNATGREDLQSIVSEFEIFRGALAKIFIDPVLKHDAGVKLIFDEYVDGLEQREDGRGVVITFARSKEQKTYDLVVAADGLGSRIRGMMLDASPREQIHDEGVHAAYFTVKGDLLQGSKYSRWYNTTRGRVVSLRPDPDPAGLTRAMLINVKPQGHNPAKDRFDAALRQGNDRYMDLMDEEFRDVGWLANDVLAGMRESPDFYCSVFAQVRSPKLHAGRVVLLGDAGYATPGFGTSLAIIGAYVLAGELLNATGDGNVTAALERYEALMVPFVKYSQGGISSAMQLLNPQTRWGIWVKNTIIGSLLWLKIDQMAMVAAAWLGFTEKKLDMPGYPWPCVAK